MTVNGLIRRLQYLKEQYGDVPVKATDDFGEGNTRTFHVDGAHYDYSNGNVVIDLSES